MNLQTNIAQQFATGTSNLETHDNYRGEILRYGRFRIIVCKHGIQWIIQRNRTAVNKVAGTRWVAIAYCVTREVLARLWANETEKDASCLCDLPAHCNAGNSA